MLKHEVRLIDPAEDTIVEALTQTTAAANKRCRSRLLEINSAKGKKFTNAVAGTPEGYEMFRGGRGGVPATQVLAAWWTDAIGRKHVVLRGRRVEYDEARRLLHKEELDKRPPLFHAYPEYVCRRTLDGVEQVVCACGCGAVGTPESLSWMGPMCGPCFDRKEELGPDGLRANLPGVLYGDRDPLRSVACSPDGMRVAAVEGTERVTYWDLSVRTRTVITLRGRGVSDAAVTADGRYLLVVGVNFLDAQGLFAAFDLSADPPVRMRYPLDAEPSSLRVVPLGDPGLAVLHCWTPPIGETNRLELVSVPSGVALRGANLPRGMGLPSSACAFGTEVITISDSSLSRVFDTQTMRPARDLSITGDTLAYSHDGTHLIALAPRPVYSFDAATGVEVVRGGLPFNSSPIAPFDEALTTMAVDPVGEFVYAGSRGGRVYAFAADTLEPRAMFDWHLGPINGLCVSADGAKLFSAGGDGCVKVWPIRDLLRG